MQIGPTWERKKLGRGRVGPAVRPADPAAQTGRFFSEIRFPISFFPTSWPADGPWTGSGGRIGKRISEKNNRPNLHFAKLHS
jgi:hypothetical protein